MTAARKAAQGRMRQAAERLRSDDELTDERAVREAAAQLLERLAARDDLDVYVHGSGTNLADRILTPDPYRVMDHVKPVADAFADNGQPRPGRL